MSSQRSLIQLCVARMPRLVKFLDRKFPASPVSSCTSSNEHFSALPRVLVEFQCRCRSRRHSASFSKENTGRPSPWKRGGSVLHGRAMCLLTPSFGKQSKYHLGRCLSMRSLVAMSVTSPYLTEGSACVVRLYQTSRGCRVLACMRVAQRDPLLIMWVIIAEPSSTGAVQTPRTFDGVDDSNSCMGSGWLVGCGMVTSCAISSFLCRGMAIPLTNLYDRRYQ